MTLRSKVFIRITGLVTGMIAIVAWLSCTFAARHHRDSTVELYRQQLAVLSDRAEELVAWDDRLALKNLFQDMVAEDLIVVYAILERFNLPYVDTFSGAVPRGLMAMSPGTNGAPAVHGIENLEGEQFIHLVKALADETATLHMGLSVRKIDGHLRRQFLSIAALGACAVLIGIIFAGAGARLITREVDDSTEALRQEIDEHKQTQRELALHRDQLEKLVQERTCTLEQVTEDLRREHETAMFERRRFMVMVDSIHAGIVFFGVNGRVEYVNPAAVHILGRDHNDILNATIGREGVEGGLSNATAILESWLGVEAWQGIRECHDLDLSVVGVQGDDHTPAGSMLVLRDRTAERRMQRQLAEQERIASVGTLAAGIAHEINNPLDGLQNCLRRIINDPTNIDQIERYAGLMTASLHHIETVVRQLLDLSHKRDRVVRKINVNDTLRGAVQLASTGQRWNGVEVEWQLDENLPQVLADPQNLTQVFLNLVLNAVDAMREGGRLTIASRTQRGNDVVSNDEDVLVEIRDTGCGIDPVALPRIFEPFFTTKVEEKGTGLGLSVSRNLVVEHGGDINVKSECGIGTVFSVRLPRFFPARAPSRVGMEDGQ